MRSKACLVTVGLLIIPVVSHADPKADTAIKVDLTKADLALAEHNLTGAVNALSDATKYLSQASDAAVGDIAVMNDRVREELQKEPVSTTPPAPEPTPEPVKPPPAKPVAKRHYHLPLGYRDIKQWPYPGGVSAAVRPNEHLRDYVIQYHPTAPKSFVQVAPPSQFISTDTTKGWLPGQSEAPPIPIITTRTQHQTLAQRTWSSYPYPH